MKHRATVGAEPARATLSRGAKLLRLSAVLLALVHLGALAFVFARRLGYPFDLEWMEGGMLCHALRLLEHQPIYGPPSVDFIPFLYTPLYPALVALLAKLFGLGYALGRVISIASYVGASLLAYSFARREGGSRAAALVAIALPAAAYALTGSFYDIARPDSLWLLLVTASLLAIYHAARDDKALPRPLNDRRGHAFAALAGVLFVAAFFTKQTASPLMLAGGAALLALNFRFVPTYAAALALTGLPSLAIANRITGGWFWTYVFKLHQGHDFFARRAFVEGPIALAAIVGPALLVILWASLSRPSPAMLYASFLAVVGIGTACLASGTQWAVVNAYIPGVFFPALAIGLGAGRLLDGTQARPVPRLRPPVVYALLAISLVVKLPGLRGQGDDAFLNLGRARLVHRFDPRRFIPTVEDREAGAALVDKLRAAPGDVMVPFHPFYAYLAGKKTFVHQMGVMDVGRAGLGVPAGLAESFMGRRFSLVVLDDKIEGKWQWWPSLAQTYEEHEHIVGPRVPTGAQTVPRLVMTPRALPPPSPPSQPAAADLPNDGPDEPEGGAHIDRELQ